MTEPSAETQPSPTAAQRVQSSRNVTRMLTLAMGTAGALGFVALLWHLGTADVWAGLTALGSFVPLLAGLELGRLGCELLSTRALLSAADARVPERLFIRGQLLGQALDVAMPAGRASAEAAKAALFANHLGLPQAAAIATALQLVVLAANATWAVCGLLCSARFTLTPALRWGVFGFACATAGLVVSVCLFAAAPRARRLFARIPFIHASLERFANLLRTAPRALGSALLAQLASRGMQALQLTVLAYAFGAVPSLGHTAVMQAVHLVGAACGELVPAQLGTTDAAFVLAAPALGLSESSAFSTSLALHAIQLVVGALSFVAATALWWVDGRHKQTSLSPIPARHC